MSWLGLYEFALAFLISILCTANPSATLRAALLPLQGRSFLQSSPERFNRCSRPKGGVQLLNAKLSWQPAGLTEGFAVGGYGSVKLRRIRNTSCFGLYKFALVYPKWYSAYRA